MNKRMLIEVAISGTAGFAVGYGIGTFVTHRKMKAEIHRVLDEEIARMTADLEDIRHRTAKTGPYATPEDAAEHLIAFSEEDVNIAEYDTLTEYHTETEELPGDVVKIEDLDRLAKHFNGVQTTDDGQILSRPGKHRESFQEALTPENQALIRNIFVEDEEGEEEEEIDIEMNGPGDLHDPNRDPNKPYVISLEEYQTTRDDHHKAVVIYYEGDNTLTDEGDQIVPEIEDNVGTINLTRFGHGSGGKDTVYVRNEKTGVDFEVVRIKRGFAEEHFGVSTDEDEGPKVKRMRGDDE